MSSMLLEQYDGLIQEQGINTKKNISTSGNITVTGSGILDMSGSTGSFKFPSGITQGLVSNVINGPAVAGAGTTVVLTNAQSGSICINIATSGAQSFTLPVGVAGTEFTFICGNTTVGFTVTNASQVIHFKTSASGTVLTSTTTLTNTQGTAIVGDTISLVCDGTAWWMTAISGIFAAS